MKKYIQKEKDFRLALCLFLEKQRAVITIEETEEKEYSNIPNFGDILKKVIQVEINFDDNKPPLILNMGAEITKDNVFNVHLQP